MERRTPAPRTVLAGSGKSASVVVKATMEGRRFLRSSRPSSSALATDGGGSAVTESAGAAATVANAAGTVKHASTAS